MHLLRAAYALVKAVIREFGSDLRFVFRNMPMSRMHRYAELAAEAAEATGAQGRFWAMHDALYEHQSALGPDLVQSLALRLSFNLERFENNLVPRRFPEHANGDFMGGVQSGVAGTPTSLINEERYRGSAEESRSPPSFEPKWPTTTCAHEVGLADLRSNLQKPAGSIKPSAKSMG